LETASVIDGLFAVLLCAGIAGHLAIIWALVRSRPVYVASSRA
jgi:hypothetical protein